MALDGMVEACRKKGHSTFDDGREGLVSHFNATKYSSQSRAEKLLNNPIRIYKDKK